MSPVASSVASSKITSQAVASFEMEPRKSWSQARREVSQGVVSYPHTPKGLRRSAGLRVEPYGQERIPSSRCSKTLARSAIHSKRQHQGNRYGRNSEFPEIDPSAIWVKKPCVQCSPTARRWPAIADTPTAIAGHYSQTRHRPRPAVPHPSSWPKGTEPCR
jgi:hypothetical protein